MTTRIIDIKVRSGGAERNINKLDRKMKGLGKSADETKKQFSQLTKVATGVFSGLVASNLIKYSDSFTSLQNQIRQTTKTTEELAQTTKDLLEVSNRSRVGIAATTELFTQLTLSTENLNLTTEEQLRLTETISKSFAVSGKSAAESAGAITQLGQAFSAGALRGDEFNSIAEGAPEIMRALQRSLSLTQGELRDFAATGGITAKILVEALGGAADVIDEKMNKSVATFAQNMEIANNNMIIFIGESTQVKNVIGGAGSALVSASENLETITKLIVLGASVFASRLIPATIAHTQAVVANVASTGAQTKAVIRVGAATQVTTAAIKRAIIANKAFAISSRAASGALALIGGPLGAALIAATAIFLFVDAAEDADDRAKRLAGSVDQLKASFSELTAAQRATEISRVNNEFKSLSAELVIANDRLVKVREGVFFRGKASIIAGLEDEVDSLSGKLDELSVKRQAIFEGGLPQISGTTPEDAGGKIKAPGKSTFIDKLKLETELLTQELALRKSVSDGFFNEAEASEIQRFNTDIARKQMAFEAEFAKLGEDKIAEAELLAAFRESQLIAVEEFQSNLTGITEGATDDRLDLEKNFSDQVISMRLGVASQAVGILKSFVGESKAVAIALIAVEKGLAIGQTLINSQVAATRALAELGPIAGPPVAAQMIAIGQASAGLIAATGIAQASSLGGGGAISASLTGGSAQQAAPTPIAQELPSQTRVIDIRIDDNALLTGSMFKDAINSVLESDSDVVVNITNQQEEARRTGAI